MLLVYYHISFLEFYEVTDSHNSSSSRMEFLPFDCPHTIRYDISSSAICHLLEDYFILSMYIDRSA